MKITSMAIKQIEKYYQDGMLTKREVIAILMKENGWDFPQAKQIADYYERVFGPITNSRNTKNLNAIFNEKENETDPETEIENLWKNASKQSKVKIMKDNGWNQYIGDRQHWSVTLNTEDEYEADDFRNAIDDLWNEDSGEYSYDDVQGMGSVHIGVERYGDFSEMCGNDTYEDLDPRIRDKYVVYCEPSLTYKRRREMDW